MRFTKAIGPVAVLLVSSMSIQSQDDWKTIAPFGESFTVSLPTAANIVVRVVPLTDTEKVPARVLYSLAKGRRYAVVMFRRAPPGSIPQLPPPPPGESNRTPPLSNFGEFVTAMEWSLTKAQAGKLILDPDFTETTAVRQYELQLGTSNGVVRFREAGDSLYAQFVIGADKNDPDAKRFLTSFQSGKTNNDEKKANVIASSEGEARIGICRQSPGPDDLASLRAEFSTAKLCRWEDRNIHWLRVRIAIRVRCVFKS